MLNCNICEAYGQLNLETMTYLKGLLFTETMIVIDPQGIIIYKNNDMFERITMDY
jgi:peroxiredoxin